jgi:sec-independent protein translocase protein TatA
MLGKPGYNRGEEEGLDLLGILVILLLVFLLFGAKRLGDVGKGLGGGIRNFRDAFKDNTAPKPGSGPGDKKPIERH